MNSWPWQSIIVNIAVFGGLGAAAVGIWWMSPAWSLTVIGFTVFVGAVWSMNRRPPNRDAE